MRMASWAGTCTALTILASLGPNTSPESLSIYSVRDLRTFNMTWKQGFKTNSLPFLSLPALQCGKLMKWRARQNGMYVVWAQPKGPALLKSSLPGDEGAGRVVSLKAVRPSLTSPVKSVLTTPSPLSGGTELLSAPCPPFYQDGFSPDTEDARMPC